MLFPFGKKTGSPISSETLELLEIATAMRSRFTIELPERNGKGPSLNCSIEAYNSNSLLLDVSTSTQPLSTRWKGRKIECYFSIVRFKPSRSESFYNFRSTLLDIRKTSRNILVELSTPAEISSGQRRKSLRVRPALGTIIDIHALPASETTDKDSSEAGCALPPLESLADSLLCDGSIRCMDISAGGIRIGGETAALQAKLAHLEIGAIYLLHLELAAVTGQDAQSHWLKARIVVAGRSKDVTNEGYIGLEFTHEAKPTMTGTMEWVEVRGGCVYRLSKWTNALYMEYVRKSLPE